MFTHPKLVYQLLRKTRSIVPCVLTSQLSHMMSICSYMVIVHGGRGFGSGNADGTRILDLCTTANLAVTNTYFMKPDSHLVTYRSGNSCTQVDYIVTRRSDLKQVQDVKVIGNEECVTQHKLLVCEMTLRTQIRKQHKLPLKRRIWKLRKPEVQEKYKKAVEASINSLTLLSDPDSEADVESIWT